MIHDPRCLVSMWSEWSSCLNGTCHRLGTQTRTRMYADKRAAMSGHCSERLEEQKSCTMDCGDDHNNHHSKNKDKSKMMSSLR